MEIFTKLNHKIVGSSIWAEDSDTKVVWVTMLALADKNGLVDYTLPMLARVAGVELEKCQAAIEKFMGPDPHSRTKDNDGRRITESDNGGWILLNYKKYHESEMERAERVREQTRERVRNHREKKKQPCNAVTHGNAHIDIDIDINKDVDLKKKEKKITGVPIWEAYKAAYLERYRVEPIRNAKVNTICKRIFLATGEQGPSIVKYYLSMKDKFYEQAKHPIELLERDLTKINTLMMQRKKDSRKKIDYDKQIFNP